MTSALQKDRETTPSLRDPPLTQHKLINGMFLETVKEPPCKIIGVNSNPGGTWKYYIVSGKSSPRTYQTHQTKERV